jgi:hypothetical protein
MALHISRPLPRGVLPVLILEVIAPFRDRLISCPDRRVVYYMMNYILPFLVLLIETNLKVSGHKAPRGGAHWPL